MCACIVGVVVPVAVQGIARIPICGFMPPPTNIVTSQDVVGHQSNSCTAQRSLVGAKLALEHIADVESAVINAEAKKEHEDTADMLMKMPRDELIALLRVKQMEKYERQEKERQKAGPNGSDDALAVVNEKDISEKILEEEDEDDDSGKNKRPEWYDIERLLRRNANFILNLYLMQMQRLSANNKYTTEDDLAAQLAVNLSVLLPLTHHNNHQNHQSSSSSSSTPSTSSPSSNMVQTAMESSPTAIDTEEPQSHS